MNQNLIINERKADIGAFTVGRLLPVREKRQVGPITFLDHMGPATIGNGRYLDVDQHPHIGLSTLTYLLEGTIEHHDSLGSLKHVGPGDVGFMTAGKGITHTERTPASMRNGESHTMHGYQLWIALPVEKEEMEPAFDFVASEDLPTINKDGIRLTIVAGEAFGKTSPVTVHSPLFIVDLKSEKDTTLQLQGQLDGEVAIVAIDGNITIDKVVLEKNEMFITENANNLALNLKASTRLLLLGGKAFPEPRYLLWNFVSSRKERLEQAKNEWINRQFPKVPGDNTYVPFP